MPPEAVLYKLHEFNKAEEIYLKYEKIKASGIKKDLENFISSLSQKDIEDMQLVLPEIPGSVTNYFNDDLLRRKNNFLISITSYERCKPAFAHRHSYFETMYVIEGEFTHNVHHKKTTFEKGDSITIPPGVEHSLYVPHDSIVISIRCQEMTVHKLFANSLFTFGDTVTRFFMNNDSLHIYSNFMTFHSANNQQLRRILLTMYAECLAGKNESSLYALLALFWSCVWEYCSDSIYAHTGSSKKDVLINTILNYLLENYRDCNINDLSKILNYSPQYTSAIVKKVTGKSFASLRAESRAAASTELLLNSKKSINAISDEMGYKNQESYIRTFKNIYHMTPTEYRKKRY